jgi:hypothetical protein
MAKRPLPVTIIAWFLIVTSLFGLFSALTLPSNPAAKEMLASSPLSPGMHQAIGAISAAIAIACAVGMLKGLNWSRYAYVAVAVLGLLLNLATMRVTTFIVVGLLFIAVIAFFLFRSDANAWFTGRDRSAEA